MAQTYSNLVFGGFLMAEILLGESLIGIEMGWGDVKSHSSRGKRVEIV